MTNTTQTYWSVDGVSLQTFAFNITTLGGDRLAPPPVRGRDQEIPYMTGTRWVERVVDARTISLGMWVIGANEDGSVPLQGNRRRQFDKNWAKLRKLLWTPRRQFTLTKKFWVLLDDLEAAGVDPTPLPKSGEFALYEASAKGSYAGGLVPLMNGPARAVFTVDIRLSDPFFYSEEIEVPFSINTGSGLPGPSQNIFVLGDDRTSNIEIDLEGPLTSAQLSNTSEEQALWVRYASVVPDDETATIRVHNFSATQFPSGQPYKTSGYVQHAGDKNWLYLEPGDTNLLLESSAGTGKATLRYRPAWM